MSHQAEMLIGLAARHAALTAHAQDCEHRAEALEDEATELRRDALAARAAAEAIRQEAGG